MYWLRLLIHLVQYCLLYHLFRISAKSLLWYHLPEMFFSAAVIEEDLTLSYGSSPIISNSPETKALPSYIFSYQLKCLSDEGTMFADFPPHVCLFLGNCSFIKNGRYPTQWSCCPTCRYESACYRTLYATTWAWFRMEYIQVLFFEELNTVIRFSFAILSKNLAFNIEAIM